MKRMFGAVAAVLGFFLATSPAAFAQSRPALLTGLPAAAAPADVRPAAPTLGLLRQRPIALNAVVLQQVRSALLRAPLTPVEISVPAFDDTTLVVRITKVRQTGHGTVEFLGTVNGDAFGSATLVMSHGLVAGTVQSNDHAYQIRSTGFGNYQVRDIDRSQIQDEAGAVPEPHPLIAKAIAQQAVPAVQMDDGSTIDLLVVYTPAARAQASPSNTADSTPILSEIDLAVAVTNQAYENSGVIQRVRLVGAQEVAYTEVGGDLSTDLGRLSNKNPADGTAIAPDGFLDNVQTLRDSLGADVVSLWVVDGGGAAAGLGWLMSSVGAGFESYAYNVVVWDQASSNLTLPHEMGHNMGLRHDVFMDNGVTPFAYAHGYVDLTHRFRTVMAYNNQCTATAPNTSCSRITGFSSPLFSYDGAPQGTAAGADSARVLNATRTTVANFRASVASAGTLVFRDVTIGTNEGAGSVLVPVARLGGTSGAASVNWSTTAVNAIDGTDFTMSSGTLNWSDADGADKNISVPVLTDSVADGEKTFTVTLSGATGAVLTGAVTATVNIADVQPDAFPAGCTNPSGWSTPAGVSVGWFAAPGHATEGHCSFKTHNVAPPASCSVPLAFNSAQAQFTGAFLAGNITFDARVSSYPDFGCLQVTIDGGAAALGGTCADANEVLTLPGLTPTPSPNNDTGWQHISVPVTAGTHTVKLKYQIPCVTDGDNAAYVDNLVMPLDPASIPTLNFSQPTYTIMEGGLMISALVTRSGPATGAIGVTWATANGAAIAGTDFGTTGNPAQKTGTLSWLSGDSTPKAITIGALSSNISVMNDAIVNGTRDFALTLSSPTGGAALGAQSSATVNILDNDSVVEFDAPALSVSEAGPNVTLNVTRAGSLSVAQTVMYSTTAGTATAITDFTTTTGTISFAAGESVKPITIGPVAAAAPHIAVINDTVIEGPETFTVTLSSPTGGATLGAQKTSTITIISDDRGVSMAAATQSVAENAGAVDVQVLRSGPATGAVTVNYAFTNGTAMNGTHFTGTSGQVSWADGDGAPKLIHVPIIDDSVVNANRTFTVTLSGATNATLGTPMSTLVTVVDDDNTVQFSVASASVTEGMSLSLTVTRLGGAANPASVQWSTANGTAVAGTDFGASGVPAPVSGTLNWAANDKSSKTIMIPTINDTTPEGARTFTVNLSSPVATAIGTMPTVNVTMNDNDTGFVFSSPTYSVVENAGKVMLTVNRVGTATMAISVKWVTQDGTANAGSDFGVLNSAVQSTGTLSWAAGDATAKTITIPILNDAIAESDETFTVKLQSPSAGAGLGNPNVATVTIQDDDIPPESELAFSQPKYLVLESGGSVVLSVNRNDIGGGFGRMAIVNYATAPGTALATSDYTTRTGTLTWLGGDSSPKTITVPIVNDSIAENPEYFKVNLSNATPGTRIATPSASVLIVDDDEVFPPAGAFPANWVTPLGATAGWSVSNDPGAFEGVLTLKSDSILDNQYAQTAFTAAFNAGTVGFRVRVSSEQDFDVLRFYVDGVLQPAAQWSGTSNTTWQLYSVPITAGNHTLVWSYEKDGTASVGQDAAWIDAVTLPPHTP